MIKSANVLYSQTLSLVDRAASDETQALYSALLGFQSGGKTIFGQQDALLYGRTWQGDQDRSDVKDVIGSHPGIIGLDLEKITHSDENYRRMETQKLINVVKQTYRKQGIVTMSWHMSNPANGGSFYWEENPVPAVGQLLPGGEFNQTYKSYLDLFARFLLQCQGKKGEPIPILFRPFHEFDGEWFWWGAQHCSREEFVALWQYTVKYLRDEKKVHQLLYVFSPDCRFDNDEQYLQRYPGDEYVDVLGMDNYWDFRPDGANDPSLARKKLDIVYKLALKKGKVAALTEFGLEGVTQNDWFSTVVAPLLSATPIAYAMIWRNAHDLPNHFYVPTAAHPAVEDFKKFLAQPQILLQENLKDIYQNSN